jgi:hypothetical protein
LVTLNQQMLFFFVCLVFFLFGGSCWLLICYFSVDNSLLCAVTNL